MADENITSVPPTSLCFGVVDGYARRTSEEGEPITVISYCVAAEDPSGRISYHFRSFDNDGISPEALRHRIEVAVAKGQKLDPTCWTGWLF